MSLSVSNIESKAFGQLPVPNVKSSDSRIVTSSVQTKDNDIMTIRTTDAIQGIAIKQEEPVIRRAILSCRYVLAACQSFYTSCIPSRYTTTASFIGLTGVGYDES